MKKKYMSPKREDLHIGAIVPIYSEPKSQKQLIGYAELKKQFSEQYLPYVRAEIGSNEKQESHLVIWATQKWKITFVDPIVYNPDISTKERWKYRHQEGFTTIRRIGYFVTVSSNYPSYYNSKNHMKEYELKDDQYLSETP